MRNTPLCHPDDRGHTGSIRAAASELEAAPWLDASRAGGKARIGPQLFDLLEANVDVYYVGGFGVMGWVAASEYCQAQSDPLVEHKSDIMQHMNADHKDALILLAKRFAGIEAQEAEMTAVDRLGFHLRLKTQDGMKGTRIAFLREVSDPSQTREVFVEMVKQARQG